MLGAGKEKRVAVLGAFGGILGVTERGSERPAEDICRDKNCDVRLFAAASSSARIDAMEPTEPSLRPPRHRVSPRARLYWAIRALTGWLVPLAAEIIWLVADASHRGPLQAALAVTVVAAVLHVSVMPQWRYRVHRWEATPQAVYTQAGWFDQERRIAPVSRIQTVDSERGPFEQLFGLANVTVTTASAAGPLKIHGLDRRTAERLVDELTEGTQAERGDAT
jgi:membrane protein YdbS with pleckstrin-like domain